MTTENKDNIAILSCGVFEKELRRVIGDRDIKLLPPYLHLYSAKLREALSRVLCELKKEYEKIVVVYGRCMPDIDQFLMEFDAKRIKGEHCLEIIGGDTFWKSINEVPGTYFLTPGYARSFREGMIEGMQLDKTPRIKDVLFRNYKRIVYLDSQVYGDMDDTARFIANYLGLPLHIERVGIFSFQNRLNEVMKRK